AVTQEGLALALLDLIREEATVQLGGDPKAELRFRKRPGFAEAPMPERIVARPAGAEQSNSSLVYDEYAMLKLYRRLQPGLHPEVEMASFLAERGGFANTPPVLATVELGYEGEEDSALGVLFGFVRNQGDGWTLALNYLTRYLDDALIEGAPGAAVPGREEDRPDPDHFFLNLARQLGLRTAEMHRLLAEYGN